MTIIQSTQKVNFSKKFCKKYELLEISLSNFVYWRNQHFFEKLSQNSLSCNINTTLEQELLLIKKISFLPIETNNGVELKQFVKDNCKVLLYTNFLPKHLFLSKIPFIQYCIIPFLGFIIFNFRTLEKKSISATPNYYRANLLDKSQSNELNANIININSLRENKYYKKSLRNQIILKNKVLENKISSLVNLEKKELEILFDFYLKQLEKNLHSDLEKIILLQKNNIIFINNLSNQSFTRKKIKTGCLNWNWFQVNANLKCVKYLPENSLTSKNFEEFPQNLKSIFLKNWIVNFSKLPIRLDLLSQTSLESKNLKIFFPVDLKKRSPIESYKTADLLLDNLIKKTVITENPLILNPKIRVKKADSKTSQLLLLINDLCNEIDFSKLQVEYTTYEKIHPNREILNKMDIRNFISENLTKTKLKIQQNLDDLILIKILNNKQNKYFKLKKNLKRQDSIVSLSEELVFLKKLKTVFVNLNGSKVKLELKNDYFKTQINPLKVQKKYHNISKQVTILNTLLLTEKNGIDILEFKTPLLMTKFNLLENKSQKLNERINFKIPFQVSKQMSFSTHSPHFLNNFDSRTKIAKNNIFLSQFLKLNNQFQEFELNSFFKKQNPNFIWIDFYNFNYQQFLNYIISKIEIVLAKKQINLVNNHSGNKPLVFSQETLPINDLKRKEVIETSYSNLISSINLIRTSQSINFTNNSLQRFKLKAKSKVVTKSSFIRKMKNPKIEKILKSYLSSKLSLTRQGVKNVNSEGNIFQTKKNYIHTLDQLKKRFQKTELKAKNQNYSSKNFLHFSTLESTKNKPVTNIKKIQFEFRAIKFNNKKIPFTKRTKLSPNSLFKKIGFIFLNKVEKKNIEILKKENLNSLSEDSKTWEQIQNQKAQQKKQRRRKQNLETRRRKKRKRFYPRPTWLRFQLYQNFLYSRHNKNATSNLCLHKTLGLEKKPKSNTFVFFKRKSFNKLRNFSDRITLKSEHPNFSNKCQSRFLNHFSSNSEIKSTKTEKQINLLKFEKNKNLNFIKQRIYRKNKEKWGLIIHDKPYLEKSFIQEIPLAFSIPILSHQDFYKISNTVMSDFQKLCWKSYWLRSNLTPYITRIQDNLGKIKEFQQIVSSKEAFKKFLSSFFGFDFYKSSTQNKHLTEFLFSKKSSLKWYLNYNTSFKQDNRNASFSFLNYKENISAYNQIISRRMANIIKNVKTNLNTNGQIQAKSFSQGHQKMEHSFKKNNWNELGYSISSQLENLFQNSSEASLISKPIDFNINTFYIPSNQLTTLRILWSLNQTNLLSFKQNNDIKNLWQYLKIREQNKSNKTKKFLLKNIKTLLPKNTQTVCFEKTERIFKKLKWHKINVKNSQSLNNLEWTFCSNFRGLKLKLKKVPSFGTLKITKKSISDHLENQNILKSIVRNNVQTNIFLKKSQKNSIHFWWSTQNSFSAFKQMFISVVELDLIKSPKMELYKSILIFNTLWFCAILFHLSILFSLLRISEIRNLMKFYFLIVSKISQSYFGILDIIYTIFNNYKNQSLNTLKSIQKELNFLYEPSSNKFRIKKLNLQSKNLTNSEFFYPSLVSSNGLIEKFIIRIPNLSLKKLDMKPIFLTSINFYSNNTKFDSIRNWPIFKNETSQKILLSSNLSNSEFYPINLKKQNFNLKTKLSNTKNSNFLSEKFQSLILLPSFLVIKFSLVLLDSGVTFFYKFLFKIIDILESFVMIIYKFLEKPAELLIEWIGQIFLIEWSTDIVSFLPDLLDTNLANSFSKFSRGSRTIPIIGFIIQRRLWCFMEIFIDSIQRPDIDLLERQKKGIIFWDIWAEVLIQAAENYQLNLSSFMTLKEEQDLFMERILEDSNWNWSNSSMLTMSPLISYLKKDNCSTLTFSVFNSKYSESIKISSQLSKRLNSSNFFSLNKQILNLKNFTNENLMNSHFLISKKMRNSAFKFLNEKIARSNTKIEHQMRENFSIQSWKRWSANQSFTYQGIDTDLFVDLHPPKSFQHVQFLRSSELAQQTLGPLICQIYSGIFSTEIAKNILVVGSKGSAKSLFIQAFAGETELKIMTDHAQRYAIVQRGVAVGMKLLRDVFDAIALYTPCIFLMEEIHLIGERRPMLISDQENAFSNENIFGIDQEEVHEKNQLLYQWSRHNISHYRRPYKSDFSVMIPTNHFCFDLFLGVSSPKSRKMNITPTNPLPLQQIENQLTFQNSQSLGDFNNLNKEPFDSKNNLTIISSLQLPKDEFFTPPATSPFMIFALKEQQKIKPRKRVKQMPWGGFSFDQMNLLPKVSYSIRIKVAMLADLAIQNLSVKLDMITDLLVILDNVRSNRGFVVFATTHVPSLLDPALRRPGRFDETISLPVLPNLLNRWQILRTNLADFGDTLDFLDYSLVTSTLNETSLLSLIDQTKLSLFNTLIPNNLSMEAVLKSKKSQKVFQNLKDFNFPFTFVSDINSTNLNSLTTSNLIKLVLTKKESQYLNFTDKPQKVLNHNETISLIHSKFPLYSLNQTFKVKMEKRIINPLKLYKTFFKENLQQKNMKNMNKDKSRKNMLRKVSVYRSWIGQSAILVSLVYFKIGTSFINQNFVNSQNSSHFIMWKDLNQIAKTEEFIFKELCAPNYDLKFQIIRFFSGKIAELFVLNSCRQYNSKEQQLNFKKSQKFSSDNMVITQTIFKPFSLNQQFQVAGGFDGFWQAATTFILSSIQKRFLYQKNLLVTKLLNFEDFSLLTKPPSPPASSILMPAKKYENFQRTHFDFQQKKKISIREKLHIHQQQRLIKTLYQKPINNLFPSEILSNRLTNFESSWKELSFFDPFMLKSSSINGYYHSRIMTRHKFHLIHQWWTGQLAEHNIETTFLSDIDWRSMFVKSIGDLVIDFPDSEQYYNPRSRRWFLNSTSWNYWFNFDKTFSNEIISHFLIESFNRASQHLNDHRESIDYYAYLYLKAGLLKEIDLINIQTRFYLK